MERRRKKDIHYLMQNSFRSFFCTARTKISIQLFTSGSLDSLNNWKRDLEGALTPACMATALPQTPSERSRHIFMTVSLQIQDEQFFLGIFILALGFQTWCTEKICLQPPFLVPAAASQVWPYCSSSAPKTSIRRRSQALGATNLATTI